VELDSNDVESRRWLALASLRNDQGALHGKGADIDLAISQMKRLRSQFEDQTLDGALLLALADRGRFDEILQLDPPAECEDPDARDMALVARSARDGVAASIAYMERSTRNARERRARLMGVALLCVRVGRVEDCQAFLQEIRRGGQLEVEEEKLLRLLDVLAKRYSPPTSSRTPEDAIRLLMYRSLTGDGKGMRAMLAPELLAARDTAELRELLKGMDLSARGLTQAIPGGEVTIANMFQVESEGDPKSGVRLRLTLPALGQSVGDQAYVTPGPQGFRLLAMSGTLDCIGLYALQLVERGMLAEARQWLDWAKEESGASAEASGPMELGWRWWMRSQNGDERHRLRSAAAGLAAQLAVPNEARKVLLEERERAGSEEERDAFDLAHAQCLLKLKRWSALEPLLATLSQRYPDSRGVHELRLESYLEQAKWTEARALIDARQSRHPDEFALMRERVSIEERSGNRAPGWDQSHRKLLAHGKATRQDFNLYAWALLVKGGPADSALAMARRACEPESQAGPAALHTLALANAHAGRLQDANRALQQQMRAAGTRSLGSPEWLVVGRIAESLGESAVARTAYGRVEELPGERGRPNSVWAVARSRLAGLGNP
jgi:hypothetical protein